ncbi:MAG: hypothetical protein ACYTE0_06430 [Planctomycetota bacterium]|jgi:spermidine synthase
MIQENLITEYSGTSFSVTKVNGVSRLTFSSGDIIDNISAYGEIFMGDGPQVDPDNFYYLGSIQHKRIFEGIPDYPNVLVLGLGLGLLPQYIKENKSFVQVIDVIDNNQELIDYVDFIDNSINVINADAYTYTPDKMYDLIIADLWWDNQITVEQRDSLNEHYEPHINNNGRIYYPIMPNSYIKIP